MKYSIRKFVTGKNGKVIIAQPFNIPISAWLIFTILGLITSSSNAKADLRFFADASLVTWAYLEIRCGDSPFRRLLGSVVLAYIVIKHIL